MEENKVTSLDLSSCDTEPIHKLGKIQSHGYLLSLQSKSLDVVFGDEKIEEVFNIPFASMENGHDFLTKKLIEYLSHFIADTHKKEWVSEHIFHFPGGQYLVILNKMDNLVHIEFEKVVSTESLKSRIDSGFAYVMDTITSFETLSTEEDLVSNAAYLLRSLTGFDRVMTYKFDAEGNGQVIAEEKKHGLESFLGLHYPASDIPKQARALYLRNKTRTIEDVYDDGKKILKKENASEDEPDLSLCIFRSVSPVHIQYLKNMGVTATHGVSLIINQKLWGMLICHHYSGPFHLGSNDRVHTRLVGNFLSTQISMLNSREHNDRIAKTWNLISALSIVDKKKDYSLKKVLDQYSDQIKELFSIDSYHLTTPKSGKSKDIYTRIIDYLDLDEKQPVYSNSKIGKIGNELFSDYPYSGFMTLRLGSGQYLFLERKEKKEKVYWAGNPEKAMVSDPRDPSKLSPRNSFALWEKEVEGQSEEWTKRDIDSARLLREKLISQTIESVLKHEAELEKLLTERNRELQFQILNLEQKVTELNNAEVLLRQAKHSAEALNKIKSEMIANLSHEMRTPVHGLLGLAQVIKQKTGDEKIKRYADLQEQSGNRLLALVNRILELDKSERGLVKLNFEELNLTSIINDIIKSFELEAQKKGIKIQHIPHNKELVCTADRFLIEQILINMISNGIKYNKKGGKLEISSKRLLRNKRQYVVLTFEDSGSGISYEDQQRIYEPFYILNEPTRQSDKSVGLGLYLVKKYCDYLNATIEVESILEKGTTFTLYLPINNFIE
jgi:light-regulated signal transduction histidine kinase (bacteriophytochrome)